MGSSRLGKGKLRLSAFANAVAAVLFAAVFLTSSSLLAVAQDAEEANANSAAESPTPTPSPTPVALSNAVTEADAVAARLRIIRTAAEESPAIVRIANSLPELRR